MQGGNQRANVEPLYAHFGIEGDQRAVNAGSAADIRSIAQREDCLFLIAAVISAVLARRDYRRLAAHRS
jgi:hypothetical protein